MGDAMAETDKPASNTSVPASVTEISQRTAALISGNDRLRQELGELRQKNALLSQRLERVAVGFQVDRDSHRAALNLIEDATLAHDRLLAINAELQNEIRQRLQTENAFRELN